MYATDYFETAILNSMRGIALTAPGTMYLALFLTNPTETGTAGTEVTYGEYARIPVTFSTPAAVASNSNTISIQNETQLTFASADIDAGTVKFIALMDSLTGGNMWAYGELTDALQITAGVAPVFTVGSIVYTLSGNLTTAFKEKYLNVLRGYSVEGFNLYAALYNGDPESGGAELSGNNYARVLLDLTAPEEASSGQMRVENSVEAAFNRPTTDWGTWVYTALFNAESGGQPVWKLALTTAMTLTVGRMPNIAQGAIRLAVN